MASEPRFIDDDKTLEAVKKATKDYNFCPNRVWALVESFHEKEHELRILFPPDDPELDRLFCRNKDRKLIGDKHDRCTFDFCEYSLLNFESVKQRHESRYCVHLTCNPINNTNNFPNDALNNAAKEKLPTAWQLYGRRITQPHQDFMAISHVWSDGTGMGNGQTNTCLFNFFRDVAIKLECEGIWWDAICIPTDKVARALAIQNMQENYEQAKVTLVHDCFLRDLPWTDAETACLAVTMSPWFGRGWTALELARSRSVKIMFKGEKGYILKDLDREILYNPQTRRHKILCGIIFRLRESTIQGVDDLLCVLRSRYTSWTKDMATISALLVNANIEPENEIISEPEDEPAATEKARNIYQQEIFERVVKKIGRVEYGHLFHNLPTMFDGASWCPSRLLSLLPSFSDKTNPPPQSDLASHPNQPHLMQVDAEGNVIGVWKAFPTSCASPEQYDWRDLHPLIAARVRSALKQGSSHHLLVEPLAKKIIRAVVAKSLDESDEEKTYQFIGSVRFKHPQNFDENLSLEKKITILNRINRQLQENKKKSAGVQQVLKEPLKSDTPETEDSDEQELERSLHQVDDYHWPYKGFAFSADDIRPLRSRQLRSGRRQSQGTASDEELVLAAKEGRDRDVSQLLSGNANTGHYDKNFRTPMSWAAIKGHGDIVKMLLDNHRDRINVSERMRSFDDQFPERSIPVIDYWSQLFEDQFDSGDKYGLTPLAWAARHGHKNIVDQLLHWHEIEIDSIDRVLWTPLTYAVANGNAGMARLLLNAGAKSDSVDACGSSLLAVAVEAGRVTTAKLLLKLGADVEGLPGKVRPLWIAASGGNLIFLELLIDNGADISITDGHGSALHSIARAGHTAALELLIEKGKERLTLSKPPLKLGDILGVNKQHPITGSTALELASMGPALETFDQLGSQKGHKDIVRLLLTIDTINVNPKDEDRTTPLHTAASNGDDAILGLLLKTGKAIIDAKDRFDMTPLFCAAEHGHENAVKMLLESKADVNMRIGTKWKGPARTPLGIAKHGGYNNIAELLKPYTSRYNRLHG